MFDQIMENFRRASESSFQLQQDLMKSWAQPRTAAPQATPSAEQSRHYQRRYLELLLEVMNTHRETLDATYRAGIHAIDEAFRVSDAKSPEEYRRAAEDLWKHLFDGFRSLYETQLQEFQKFTSMSFDMAQQPRG